MAVRVDEAAPRSPRRWRRAWRAFRRALRPTTGHRAYYKGAEHSRLLLDWIVAPLKADEQIRRDLLRLRHRARELARNNPYVRHYLRMLRINVVGPKGVKMQGQVHLRGDPNALDEEANSTLERGWKRWSRHAGADGCSLKVFANRTITAVAQDGEAFVRLLTGFPNEYGFALELIDPDLIDHEYNRMPVRDGENEIRLGIEIDRWHRPVAYYVWSRYPNDMSAATGIERIRVPAEQVLHLYDPERINQTRGTSWLNPIMWEMKVSDGYVEAELVAARTAAAKMGWLQYKDAGDWDPPDPKEVQRYEAEPGVTHVLPPGLEFEAWDPQHPSGNFPPFMKSILRRMATGLTVAYNSFANDLESVNWSSIRSGLLVERDNWQELQHWFIESFFQPVFEKWLEAALLSRALPLPAARIDDFLDVRWMPRGWPWVDPLKEVSAALLAINAKLDSRTNVAAERGDDLEDVFERIVAEEALAALKGVQLPGDGAAATPSSTAAAGAAAANDGDEDEPLEGLEDAAAHGEAQGSALNGAQIAALLEIVKEVSAGNLPKESAVALIGAAFPLMTETQISGILAAVEEGAAAPDDDEGQPAGGDDGEEGAVNGAGDEADEDDRAAARVARHLLNGGA